MDTKTRSLAGNEPGVKGNNGSRPPKTLYPDCPWSWMIAVACSCMNFFTVVMIRSAGVVYVNIVTYYNVSRQEAAWPISIVPGCANLIGPVVALIVRRFGVRIVAISGTFISSVAIMLCFFAPNILYLSVFLGVFHGLGSGMTITPNAVCLNEWFDKKKVRASGIIYTGATLGSFVFPVLFKYCNDVFGIRGCFLIFGALMMNSTAWALFIRSPPWRVKARKQALKSKQAKKAKVALHTNGGPKENQGFELDGNENNTKIKPIESLSAVSLNTGAPSRSLRKQISQQSGGAHTGAADSRRPTFVPLQLNGVENVLPNKGTKTLQRSVSEQPTDPGAILDRKVIRSDSMTSNESAASEHLKNSPNEDCDVHEEPAPKEGLRRRSSTRSSSLSNFYCIYEPTAHTNTINTIPEDEDAEEESQYNPDYQLGEEKKPRPLNPTSVLVALTYVFVTNGNMAFMTVLMDFAQDRHIELDKAVYLLSGFATADIVGRLSIGWVSDKEILDRKTILGLACTSFGVVMQIMPLFDSYEGIMFMCILVGYTIGNTVVLFTVVLTDGVGVERLPMAMGLVTFFAGVTAFSRPALIGHFRDNVGSYDNMIRCLGAAVLILGILWLVLRLFEKTRSRAFDIEKVPDTTTVVIVESKPSQPNIE